MGVTYINCYRRHLAFEMELYNLKASNHRQETLTYQKEEIPLSRDTALLKTGAKITQFTETASY